MAEVLLLGEDKTHAVLLGVLLREVLREAALAGDQPWLLDWLDHVPAVQEGHVLVFRGDEDLAVILPGLRYTSTLRPFEPTGPGGRPLKLRGHIEGNPVGPEATKWRKVFHAVLPANKEPDAILVAKDTDGDESRLEGLCLEASQARKWREEIGFDPVQNPESLTAHPNTAATDAKRVLRRLLGLGDESRALSPEELRDHHNRLLGDLPRLQQRGEKTRLGKFLGELRERLVPLWLPPA